MSAKQPQADVGKTGVASVTKTPSGELKIDTTQEPKPEDRVLVGKCSYPKCPYTSDSKYGYKFGVVMIKNTDLVFHPDCHNKWTQEEAQGAGATEPAIQRLQEAQKSKK